MCYYSDCVLFSGCCQNTGDSNSIVCLSVSCVERIWSSCCSANEPLRLHRLRQHFVRRTIVLCHCVAAIGLISSSLSVCSFAFPTVVHFINTKDCKHFVTWKLFICQVFVVSFSFPTPPFVQCWKLSVSRWLDSCWHTVVIFIAIYSLTKAAPLNHKNDSSKTQALSKIPLSNYSRKLLQYATLFLSF